MKSQRCSKADLLILRLVSHSLSHFATPYMDRYLALEIRTGTNHHLHRAATTISTPYMKSNSSLLLLNRLLATGTPVNQRDENGETALHVAARHGYLEGLHRLLTNGAQVDATSAHGWTPLHLACRYGCVRATRVLLDFGAGVNRWGFHGWTALHYAVRGGYKDCVRVLLRYGADAGCCDNDGLTPGVGAFC